MRKILFRGRRIDGGGWAVGSLIKTEKFCCILDEAEAESMDYPYLDSEMGWIDGKVTPVIPKTVGQYTGLKDRKGNKIFEGDIVEEVYDTHRDSRYEVNMNVKRGGWYPFAKGDGCGCCEWEVASRDSCEVIGNIHYNPELLKGGADND